MATLLKALGLPTLAAGAAPPPVAPTAAAPPAGTRQRSPDAPPPPIDVSRLPPIEGPDGRIIDLNLPMGYDPDAPAKKPADLGKLPSDPKARVDFLADAVIKVQDAVKRDKLVAALRDAIVKIQPVMDDKEAKKKIDEAIDSLISAGSKKLLTALLVAIVGKAPTKMPEDGKRPTGPPLTEKDLGETIFKSPELPLPWDKPKKTTQNYFEFRDLPRKARASSYIDFKLRTPHWFEPYGKMGAGRVVVMKADDHKKEGDRATKLADKRIEQKGEVAMRIGLPDEPGAYVVGVYVGSGLEHTPLEPLELTK